MTPRIPTLTTDRLTLRAPVPGDFDAYAGFMAQRRSHFVGGPLTRPAAWQAFATSLGHWVMQGFGMLVGCVRGTDTPMGLFGFHYPEGYPDCELGWQIWDQDLLRDGYAKEAGRALLAHAPTPNLVSYIAPENVASRNLAQRLGATRDHGAVPPFDGVDVYRYAT